MSDHKILILQDILTSLFDVDSTLMKPLMKLNYFARSASNQELQEFTINEMEGYKDRLRVPEYRKTSGRIMLQLFDGYRSQEFEFPIEALPKDYSDIINY